MIHKQAPQALTGLALLLSFSIGCAGGPDPAAPGDNPADNFSPPPADSGIPTGPGGSEDEPYIREVTSLTEGTKSLNGSVVTFVGYQAQPGVVSTPTAAGELIFFRHRPRMSDLSTNLNLASNYFSPLLDYGNRTTSPGELSSFEVRFAINTEPIELNLWNANAPNGNLNAAAVVWDYTVKTAPALSSDEPDSDNDTNSVFDRTMANTLPMNVVVNRSMYSHSLTKLDVEEWWKVELTAGSRYTIKVGTYHPRYGTWRYRLHVRNPGGDINTAGLKYIEPLDTSGEMSILALTTGTHYLQMAGYRRTRTESSNVYFSPYSLKIAPDLPPSASVSPTNKEFLSGTTTPENMVTLAFTQVNDPEGKPVTARVDWNSDGDYNDQGEEPQLLSSNGTQLTSPLFYNNPSAVQGMSLTLTYQLSDGQNTVSNQTVGVLIGRNRRPIYSGTFFLENTDIPTNANFNLQAVDGTGPSDPEGDLFTFFIRSEVMTSNGIMGGGDNTGDFEAELRALGFSQSFSMGPFTSIMPLVSDPVRISIWLDDLGHTNRELNERVGEVFGTVHS